MATYSLSRYKLSITYPDSLAAELSQNFGANGSITIGGEGSYLESFSFSQTNNTWSVDGDNTGSYVFNKNLDRTGTAQLTLNQMSNQVIMFKNLAKYYYTNNLEEGLTLTLTKFDNDNEVIVTCTDCFITKIPDQQFQNEAQTQTWEFVVGIIDL